MRHGPAPRPDASRYRHIGGRGHGIDKGIDTRHAPCNFYSPDTVSTFYSTISTIRLSSKPSHTLDHRQWLYQLEIRLRHLYHTTGRSEHSLKVQRAQGWETASSVWRCNRRRGRRPLASQNAVGRRYVTQLRRITVVSVA
jgi:hypothetical protein